MNISPISLNDIDTTSIFPSSIWQSVHLFFLDFFHGFLPAEYDGIFKHKNVTAFSGILSALNSSFPKSLTLILTLLWRSVRLASCLSPFKLLKMHFAYTLLLYNLLLNF